MATTWNPSDKSSNIVLTNGNLTAGANTTTQAVVRATAAHGSRRYYYEATLTGSPSSTNAVGIVLGTVALTSIGSSIINGAAVIFANGQININGVYSGKTLSAFVSGDVASIAVDFDKQLVWLRKNGGNWNNDATADPATGIGGIDVSGIFTATTAFPFYILSSTTTTVTVNFGATAFAQTPPSGFNSWDTTPSDAVDLDQQYVEVINSGEPSDQKVRLDQQYVEVINTGDPTDQKVRLDQQYVEVINSGEPSDQKVRLDQQYVEVVMTLEQMLQPDLDTDTDTLYAPTITGASGAQTLTPALVAGDDAAYAPAVVSVSELAPVAYVDADTLHAPVVEQVTGIEPGIVASDDSFAAPTVSASDGVQPDIVVDDDTFDTPTVGAFWQLAPSLIIADDSVVAPSVLSTTNIQPTLVAADDTVPQPEAVSISALDPAPHAVGEDDTVYPPVVARGPLTLEPDTVLFGTAFFSPVVFIQLHVAPALFFDGDVFPFPTSSAQYEALPSSFDSDDVLYLPVITTGPITILPPLYADIDTEFTPSVQRQSKGGGNGGGGNPGNVSNNLKYASRLIMASSGLVTTLEVQASTAKTINTRMMIYADNGGLPGALLGQSDIKSAVVLGANDYALLTPVSFLTGQAFWVALHSDGNFNWFLASSPGGSRYNTDAFSDGPSDPFGASSIDNKKAPVFVVYLDATDAAMLPPLVASDDSTYAPHVTGAKALLPPFVVDQDFTYGSGAGYVAFIADDRLVSDDQILSPTVTIGAATMLPDLYVDDDVLRSPDIGRGQGDVFPVYAASDDAVYSPLVEVMGAALGVGAFDDVDAVFAPIVRTVVTAQDSTFDADDAVYTPELSVGAVTLSPSALLDSGEDFFDPVLTRIGGNFPVDPSEYDDTDVFHIGTIGYPGMARHVSLRGDRTPPQLGGVSNSDTSLLGERGDVDISGSRDDSIDLTGTRNDVNLSGDH